MRSSSEVAGATIPQARAGRGLRVACALLAGLMALFAAAQANDPDGALWGAVYGATALWCALAAARPGALRRGPVFALLILSLLAALAGAAAFWPDTPGWWRREVWWETETAREGMGLMVVALTLLAPVAVARRPRGAGAG